MSRRMGHLRPWNWGQGALCSPASAWQAPRVRIACRRGTVSVLLEHDCRNCLNHQAGLLAVGTAAWSTCPPLPALQTSSAHCGPGTGHRDLKVVKDKVRLPQGVFCPVEQSGQSSTMMEAGVEFQKSSSGKSFFPRWVRTSSR